MHHRALSLGLLTLILACHAQRVSAAGYQGVDPEMATAACTARPAGYANASRVFKGGYGAGCTFSIEEAGGTNRDESVEITAHRYMDPDEQRSMIEFVRQSMLDLSKDGDGIVVKPFGLCNGGLTAYSATDPKHPATFGFYACGPHLVFVNTKGPRSVDHYLSMANAMQGLLTTTPKPRDMR